MRWRLSWPGGRVTPSAKIPGSTSVGEAKVRETSVGAGEARQNDGAKAGIRYLCFPRPTTPRLSWSTIEAVWQKRKTPEKTGEASVLDTASHRHKTQKHSKGPCPPHRHQSRHAGVTPGAASGWHLAWSSVTCGSRLTLRPVQTWQPMAHSSPSEAATRKPS